MKKKTAFVLCLANLIAMTACSGNTGNTSGNDGNVTSISETVIGNVDSGNTSNSDNATELTVWAILSSSIDDYSTNAQSKWYEEYSGVKVNWINIPQHGWADQFQLSVMSGDLPDVYLYDFDTTEVQACVEFNAIIPLTKLIEDNCPNVKEYLDNDPELRQDITANDGEIYTLFSKSYDINSYKQKLWVNKSWLTAYETATGKNMPATTDEFKAMLQYFKDNDMNGNGDTTDEIPYLGYNGLDGMYFMFNSFVTSNSSSNAFGCYKDDTGNIVFSYNTDEFRNALRYINDLYQLGLISDQSFTISSADRYIYTSTTPEKAIVGVATAVTAENLVQLSASESALDFSDYVAIPPLKGPYGHQSFVSEGEYRVSLKDAITTKCTNPEAAAKWLDYWFSEEGRLWSVNGGREGIEWEYADGETINGQGKIIKKLIDNPNQCWAGQGVSYMLLADDFLHMDISNIRSNNVLATYQANMLYHDYAKTNIWPHIVWIDGNSEASDMGMEYSELNGLIKDYVTQSYTDFIIGNRNINSDADWNAYVSELDKMGLNRYMELVSCYVNYQK